ncbi:hypothetical protein BASA81_001383 [Batrachochytrium salamandrivorans]|nr:hypothetical protein BASA81_001383 [Batrachochytrium salamandrivorans]
MLNVAVLEGDADAVYEYVFNDGDLNACNDVGNTALHACGFTGSVAIGRILLKAGAEVNSRNGKGRTPLHVAVREDAGRGLVQLLLESGADSQAKDSLRRTPRDYASPQCALVLDEWLLSRWNQSLEIRLREESDNDDDDNSDEEEVVPIAAFKLSSPMARDAQAEALLAALSHQQSQVPVKTERFPPPSPRAQLSQPLPQPQLQPLPQPQEQRDIDSPVPPLVEEDELASVENANRMFVEIDGERVYIPQPTMMLEEEEDDVEEEDGEEKEDAEEDRVEFETTRIIIQIPAKSPALGMLLTTEHEVYMLVVEELSRNSPAFRAGVRVGDALFEINHQGIERLDMGEIYHRLAQEGEGPLELTMVRTVPSLVLLAESVDWDYHFPQLLLLLQDLPRNLMQDQCFKLIHAFQECVSRYRKGDASAKLVDHIQHKLGSGDLVGRAGEIVTMAVQRMDEGFNEDS